MKPLTKILTIILMALSFLSILPTQKALAHDVYFLRILINESTMTFEGRVEFDDESFFSSEAKHSEFQLGDFSTMIEKSVHSTSEISKYDKSPDGSNYLVFSFPSKELSKTAARDGKNHASGLDKDRAMEINNVLIPSLNGILMTINNGKSFAGNKDDFANAINAIIKASNEKTATYKGWTLTQDTETLMTVKNTSESYKYIYALKKGYKSKELDNGQKSPVYDAGYSGDTDYINVGMLAAQGYYARAIKNFTTSNPDEAKAQNILDKTLGEALVWTVDLLEAKLGLYTIDELVYNRGPRVEYNYHKGLMKSSWMDISSTFYMVFQVLAWSLLTVAFVKALLEKNLTTMSIMKQISLMDTVQNILIAGFFLSVFFVGFEMLTEINIRLVNVFGKIAPNFSELGHSTGGATVADGLMRVFYFFIGIYLNFIYITRALTILILVGAAPLFIVSIAFSNKNSEMFSKWLRELIATVFLQSFQAVIMGVLLMAQIGSTGIETAVIAISIIPLTNMFKGLIIGEAGGVGSMVAATGAGALAGFASGALSGKGKGKGGGKGFDKDAGDGKSEIPGAAMNPERKEHSADTPNTQSTVEAKKKFGEQSTAPKEDAPNLDSKLGEVNGVSGSGGMSSRKEIDTSYRKSSTTGKEKAKKALSVGVGGAKAGLKGAGGAVAAIGGAAFASAGANQAAASMGKMSSAGLGAAGASAGGAVKSTAEKGGNLAWGGAKEIYGNAMNKKLSNDPNAAAATVMGMETLDNGNTVIHRNKDAMEDLGVVDAGANGKEQFITYDMSKMNKEFFSDWDNLSADERKDQGVDNIKYNHEAGTATFHYNNVGKKKLGFIDAYATPTRIVETKNHRNGPTSQYFYGADPNAAKKFTANKEKEAAAAAASPTPQ